MSDMEDEISAFGAMDLEDSQTDGNETPSLYVDNERQRIQAVVDAYAYDEPALIDVLCTDFGCFGPYFEGHVYQTMKEYMGGDSLSLEDAVARIAEFIEEFVAAGDEEHAMAWMLDLEYAFLQFAKRTPPARHAKLLQLYKKLAARPYPPQMALWSGRFSVDGAASEILNDVMREKDYTDGSDLDCFVPAAAAWVRVLGIRLKSKRIMESDPDSLKTGWDFWKSRFEEVAQHPGVNEETRDIANDTVVLMNNLDRMR
ncbi:hypothetical protein Ae201684P_006649 [Aphanomyces euteiches]|uniref:Uncharacterized protein n=1 Tax=Aphanomyces euteiches TaxID=100861 RepID=A0A6G0WV50_9STRA|nr:hypothetical protein Ae201684_011290 [Aphanomyces euteiches]KAH9100452.1 hypothetical protein Ae201684P_006649 [Aphanomyces euteiches]KAH9134888.1 hypothetical protein AeRB84_019458 [Aphanomyces euteiches]